MLALRLLRLRPVNDCGALLSKLRYLALRPIAGMLAQWQKIW